MKYRPLLERGADIDEALVLASKQRETAPPARS
jgi:hypothetical protein